MEIIIISTWHLSTESAQNATTQGIHLIYVYFSHVGTEISKIGSIIPIPGETENVVSLLVHYTDQLRHQEHISDRVYELIIGISNLSQKIPIALNVIVTLMIQSVSGQMSCHFVCKIVTGLDNQNVHVTLFSQDLD